MSQYYSQTCLTRPPVLSKNMLNRVPTHPGKREKLENFSSHAPCWEMSTKTERNT
jgi:hypothetical protein